MPQRGSTRTAVGAMVGVLLVVLVAAGLYVHFHTSKTTTTTLPTVSVPGTSGTQGQQAAANTTTSLPSGGHVDVLKLGVTLTGSTNLTESLPVDLLNRSVDYVNVSLGANGTSDPEPSPGVFDWSSLDARMRQVAPLSASVTMRVFDAPPWMKTADTADAPITPEHIQDFATLVVDAAKRYPQIHYFAIWNELYGYRPSNATWDFAGYTAVYNAVYDALKAYNPSLQVGGPYASFFPSATPQFDVDPGPWGALNSNSLNAVSYWLAHKAGADFVAIDGRTAQPSSVPADPVGATTMFPTVDDLVDQTPTTLPVWWMEWYARSPAIGEAKWDAVSAYALLQLAASGAAAAFMWDAEFIPGQSISTPGLWVKGTGGVTALTPVFETLKNDLYGTPVQLEAPVAGVEVLANSSHFVAIDLDGKSHSVDVLGSSATVGPYQILTG